MPTAAPKPCAHPGCPEVVTTGKCDKHRREILRLSDKQRSRNRTPYDRRAWRDRIRPQQLHRQPLCQHCKDAGLIVKATDVDHIDGNPTNNSIDNLQSLCHECHSRKTVRQDGGFGRG